MHALSILHRTLAERCPHIHGERLASLSAAVDAAMSGSVLALSVLGRELPGPGSIKHDIKRIDRLLGNDKLHADLPVIYEALARQYLSQAHMPVLIIHWSDLTRDRRWQLLRASFALAGPSMTVYEEVHPMEQATASAVHDAFLRRLATMLPSECTSIVLTKAGFRGTWFLLVNRMGWRWIRQLAAANQLAPAPQSNTRRSLVLIFGKSLIVGKLPRY